MRKRILLSLFAMLAGHPVEAATWYLYMTVYEGGTTGAKRPVVLEMDTEEGCEQAGIKIQKDVKVNKIQHVKNITFTCIKRQ